MGECPSDVGGTWSMYDPIRDHSWQLELTASGFFASAPEPCAGRWCNAENCVALPPSPPTCEVVMRARLACASTREDFWSGTTIRFESSTRLTMVHDPGGGTPVEVWEGYGDRAAT